MFRIVCDPSSGSTELCLTEINLSVSQKFSCAWSVFGSKILNLRRVCTVRLVGNYWYYSSSQPVVPYTQPLVKNYAAKYRPSTQTFLWTIKSNFSQKQLSTPWWWIAHDPKHVGVIFNCLLNLTQRRFLISKFYIIECISRIIKVTDCKNARRKTVINIKSSCTACMDHAP